MNPTLQPEHAHWLQPDSWQATVLGRYPLANGVIGLALSAPEGQTIKATPGAHLELELNAGVRHYSLYNGALFDTELESDGLESAGPDSGDSKAAYRIAVRLEEDGRGGSKEIFEQLHVGDSLMVSGPHNHFELEPGNDPVLLIAGGIGITPILAMAQACWQQQRPFEMHYVGRSLSAMALVDAVMQSPLAQHSHLYAPEMEGPSRPDIDQLIADHTRHHVYVCGPERLINAVVEAAEWHMTPLNQIHYERFGAEEPVQQDGDQAFDVVIQSSGARYRVEPGQTIAAVLAEQGVQIPTSCGSGVCGSCVTGVISGQPDHRDYFLSPEEQQANNQITLCCSRSRTAELVLDL